MEKLLNNMGSTEWFGLSRILEFMSDQPRHEIHVEYAGFNENSGHVYIALDNGITISSCMGQDLVFTVYTGEEELEFDSYEEALEYVG